MALFRTQVFVLDARAVYAGVVGSKHMGDCTVKNAKFSVVSMAGAEFDETACANSAKFGSSPHAARREGRAMKIGFAAVLMAAMASGAQATTYTVRSPVDDPTTVTANDGTLRGAIMAANAGCTGTDSIVFAITGVAAGSVATINIASAPSSGLPTITCAGLNVNGTTQPVTNTNNLVPATSVGYNPAGASPTLPAITPPNVAIVGGPALNTAYGTDANGFAIAANNVTIQGFSIRGFDSGIDIEGNFTGIKLTGNYIGVLETASSLTAAGDPAGQTNAIVNTQTGAQWSGARNNNGIRIPKVDNTANAVGVTVTGNLIAFPNTRGIYLDGINSFKPTTIGPGQTISQGNGQGYNLTIANNYIAYTGTDNGSGAVHSLGGPQGFMFDAGGGIEVEDTFSPTLVIQGNYILGQPQQIIFLNSQPFNPSISGSSGIEINQLQRESSGRFPAGSMPYEPASGGLCACTISGNTITAYLHGVSTRVGIALFGTAAFTSTDVMSGYALTNNLFTANIIGVTSGGNGTGPTNAVNAVSIKNNSSTANDGVGFYIAGAGTQVVSNNVTGNGLIGIMLGDPLPYPNLLGPGAIHVLAQFNTVTDNGGSTNAYDDANHWPFNAQIAVVTGAAPTAAQISQNSIGMNGGIYGLGIDLITGAFGTDSATGVTPNHAGADPTAGPGNPNNLHNFPVFEPGDGIVNNNGVVSFKGWARPGDTLEFFATVAPYATAGDLGHLTGFGEGSQYICAKTVPTGGAATGYTPATNPNSGGYPTVTQYSSPGATTGEEGTDDEAVPFSFTCAVPVELNNPYFTATATTATALGNVTSEFSFGVYIPEDILPPPPSGGGNEPVPLDARWMLALMGALLATLGVSAARRARQR